MNHDHPPVARPTLAGIFGAGLIYVPEAWVTPADIGIEALSSIYVSMGVTSAEHLKPGLAATAQ